MELQGNTLEVAQALSQWLAQFDKAYFVLDVCHYDFVLLINLFGTAFDLPVDVTPSCHDINQDIAKYKNVSEFEAFDLCREELLDTEVKGKKHNSLYDAVVIKEIARKIDLVIK